VVWGSGVVEERRGEWGDVECDGGQQGGSKEAARRWYRRQGRNSGGAVGEWYTGGGSVGHEQRCGHAVGTPTSSPPPPHRRFHHH
jgi:hypothetical protein